MPLNQTTQTQRGMGIILGWKILFLSPSNNQTPLICIPLLVDFLSPTEMHLMSAGNFLSSLKFVFIVCSRSLDIKDSLH